MDLQSRSWKKRICKAVRAVLSRAQVLTREPSCKYGERACVVHSFPWLSVNFPACC